MARVIIDPKNISGPKALLSREEARHIMSVLRLRVGDEVEAFDGEGRVYRARIEKLSRAQGMLNLVERIIAAGEEALFVELFLGLAKGEKMDFVVQKATEIGILSFNAFSSSRSIPKWDSQKAGSRLQRWRRISREACKQCGRNVLPEIHGVMDFHEALKSGQRSPRRYIFWEEEKETSLKDILKSSGESKHVCCMIGPEGGFSTQEIEEARSAGFIPVGLGQRILRLETAALVVLSVLQYGRRETG